ncbi:unnamed protein product [Caenorhabditis nigoni]|uniref:Potassium channel domain-containing protein n=1 Tax=Caenorhabditis briggsae TaxID=6238 RepID=A0AAE8ZS66_CAEBR|nr:hypothetical protein L3Y34_011767 [Caenorhabditis briggsae]
MYTHNAVDTFDMGSESSLSSLNEIPMEMDLTTAGPPISDDETEVETKEKKFFVYAKRILPHVGLVILLFLYLIAGAFLFRYLEAPKELETRNHELTTILGLRDEFQDHIWNITQDSDNRISREAFNAINQEYFEQLVKNMFQAYRNQFITAKHLLNKTREDEVLWTFPNSMFFAATVITTIGYGNLVPITISGRVACIIFALFGIPLLLVTIADIGKFLSEFLSYLYKSYRGFKRKLIARRRSSVAHALRRQSKKITSQYRSQSQSRSSSVMGSSKAGSMNLHDIDSESEDSAGDELRIPVFMVLLVLLAYTAIGGFLFQSWEHLEYFEAFYFCFITMATVGFGDIVPNEQVYVFFTMAYIIFGLSLATMCIDLAGTEYIRKIHYLGTKMEDAKGAVMTGLQAGEHLLKHTGIEVIKTAGGKLVQVRGAVLSSKEARELGMSYLLQFNYQHKNVLYEPLTGNLAKVVKEANIKILPDDITEKDGYIVQNKSYDRPVLGERGFVRLNGNAIKRIMIPSRNQAICVPYLIQKESDV